MLNIIYYYYFINYVNKQFISFVTYAFFVIGLTARTKIKTIF